MDKGQEFTMLVYLRLSIILASCLNGCATSEELAQAERIQVEQKQLSLQRELQTLIVNDSETTIVPLLTFSNKHHKSEVSRQAYEEARQRIEEIGRPISGNELETFISKCQGPPGEKYVSQIKSSDGASFRISGVPWGVDPDHVSIIMLFDHIDVQRYVLFVNDSEKVIVYRFTDQAWAQTINSKKPP